MPVIGGNNPTATVTVPVPTPAPMKKPKQPQQQAAPQPVPANPGSRQQDVPQGMSPVPMVPQQPEPRAIILPWAPPPSGTPRSVMRKMRVRFARTTPESVQKLEQAVKDDPDNEDLRHAWADEIEESGDKDRADVIRNGPRSIEIHGRRWFRRGPGNTYHTARIVVDGQDVPGVPMQYGYGDQYMQNATEQLEKLGHVKNRKKSEYGGGDPLWRWAQHHGVKFTYSVQDVPRQRDLHQFSRPKKYAMNDDDMDGMLDFSMEAMHPEGTEPLRRPPPKEDITGRNRKRILQQMLEAAKKGHYDPAGMTPRDYIAEMEAPKDIEPGQGQVWMSDPEDEPPPDQPTKMNRRIEYPRRMARSTPESVEKLFDAVSKDPDNHDLRAALADELNETGRHDESNHLRSGKPFSFQPVPNGGRRIVPVQYSTSPAETALNQVEDHLDEISDGEFSRIGGTGEFDLLRSNRELHQYNPEDFYEPDEYRRRIPKDHVRVIHMQEGEPHSMTDVHYNDLGNHFADMVDDIASSYGEQWFDPQTREDRFNEAALEANPDPGGEYDRLLERLRSTPGHTGIRGT